MLHQKPKMPSTESSSGKVVGIITTVFLIAVVAFQFCMPWPVWAYSQHVLGKEFASYEQLSTAFSIMIVCVTPAALVLGICNFIYAHRVRRDFGSPSRIPHRTLAWLCMLIPIYIPVCTIYIFFSGSYEPMH